MIKGIDYSWARPGGKKIKSSGYDFVIRYLSLNPEKNISLAEVRDLQEYGLVIGLVWEQTAQAPLKGFKQGVSDATKALFRARAVGFPDTCPIYFACDCDSTPGQQIVIDEYLKGCSSFIGIKRVGVYGSFYVVERCFANKSAQWFWQTLAWSGGQISKHNHIYQNGKKADISGTDINEASDDWGGWDSTITINEETMDKNYMELFKKVAMFLGKDYGENLDDKDLSDIEGRLDEMSNKEDELQKNIDSQAEKINNQSNQINALTDKLKEKDLLLQDSQAAADKNFEAVSVIKLFQEAFKKLINFK